MGTIFSKGALNPQQKFISDNDLIMKETQNCKYKMIFQDIKQGNYLDQHSKVDQIGHVYNGFATPEGNVAWAGAANLAFNEFKHQFLKNEDLALTSRNTDTNVTLGTLNKPKFSKSQIIQQSIYIKSGMGNQTIKQINQQVKRKFPFKTTQSLAENSKDNDFISYAYLFKALQYQHQFERQPGMLWFGRQLPGDKGQVPYMVEAFAAISKKCLRQIKLIEYQDKNNFLVGFKAKHLRVDSKIKPQQLQIDKKDNIQEHTWFQKIRLYFLSFFSESPVPQIIQHFNSDNSPDVIYICCSTQKQQTIDSVIRKVMDAQDQTPIDQRPSNENLNQFIMPIIDLDLNHQYSQFQGHYIQNPQLKGRQLKMVQNMKLRMDEKGVIVENDAWIGKDQCAIVGSVEIRIDSPFWLILTQEGKHPYLCVKINYLPEKEFKQFEGQSNC